MKRSISQKHVFGAVCSLALILVFASSAALGQDAARSFDELRGRLQIGDSVQVIDSGGKKLEGRIAGISALSLTLDAEKTHLELRENSVQAIRKRRHDPWWNGALIGGGIGAAAGWVAARGSCGSSDPECAAIARAAFVLPGLGIGAVAGALIDSSVRKYDTVFASSASSSRARFRLSPLVAHDKKGLQLSVSF